MTPLQTSLSHQKATQIPQQASQVGRKTDDAFSSQQMRSPTNNKKTKTHKQLNYILHGHNCEYVSSAKYCVVTITSGLKWSARVQKICQKANRTIGFLKRNLNITNSNIKENAYTALVRPTVEYASSVWDPHLQKDIHKLERIQRRSARYATNRKPHHVISRNDASTTEMVHTI